MLRCAGMRIDDHRQLYAFIAAIAPLGLLNVGCSGLARFGGDNYDGRVCVYEPQALSELTPREGVDYVGLREQENFGEPTSQLRQLSEWGAACTAANDVAACQAALTGLAMSSPPLTDRRGQIDVDYDVVFTDADGVTPVDTQAKLIALFGTIDTPNEATLLAFAAGYDIPCGENNWRLENGAYVLHGKRGDTCGSDAYHFDVTVSPQGEVAKGDEEVTERGDDNCAIGRRPVTLTSRTHKARSAGAFFANAAHLEAASVYAFTQLARELRAHGAPAPLVRAARIARADELRHARTTANLARMFGAAAISPVVRPQHIRPLLAVALDNATEGCVRETFGAVTAHVQAACARRRTVRAAMRTIARDESRHAQLSWAINSWARTRLSPVQRRALDDAQAQSVAALREEAAKEETRAIQRAAGMPTAEAKQRLLRPMERALFGTA